MYQSCFPEHLRFCLFSKTGIITGFLRFKSATPYFFWSSLQSKETQKVHQKKDAQNLGKFDGKNAPF